MEAYMSSNEFYPGNPAHAARSTDETPEPMGDDTLLLVWDAPNIDMGLGAILGARPTGPGSTPSAGGCWAARAN